MNVARQAPVSMGFPGQEHWRGLPFPPPVYLLVVCLSDFVANLPGNDLAVSSLCPGSACYTTRLLAPVDTRPG